MGGLEGLNLLKSSQLGRSSSAGGMDLAVCPPQLPVASFLTITRTDMGRSYSPYHTHRRGTNYAAILLVIGEYAQN